MVVLHLASWVVPVNSPPFQGGVVVADGQIIEVGSVDSILTPYDEVIDYGQGILMPGLINAHTHLELSHCKVHGRYEKPGQMVAWIDELLTFRDNYGGVDPAICLQGCLQAMISEGVDLIVDIGNDPSLSRSTEEGRVLFFHELLGLSQDARKFMIQIMEAGADQYTCHAPYSTSKELLLKVKKYTQKIGSLFPIHVAESLAETEFIQTGLGDFRHFIESRGSWDNSFTPPGCSPVVYLEKLGLLDTQTLCVHCVYVDEHDIQLIAQNGGHICLCPGSNLYLGVGLPPVEKMLQAGLKPCLGTDSLASNPRLSIWNEMSLIHQLYPRIAASDIVEMATCNGAAALDMPQYGTLDQGGVSMIFVKYTGDTPCEFLSFDTTPKQVRRCM